MRSLPSTTEVYGARRNSKLSESRTERINQLLRADLEVRHWGSGVREYADSPSPTADSLIFLLTSSIFLLHLLIISQLD